LKVRYVAALVLLGGLVVLVATLRGTHSLSRTDQVAAFIEKHWHRPMPAQGQAPPGYSDLEKSLDAAACAQCHPAQYQDWGDSLHSHTMGAGLLWQLQVLPPKQVLSCLDCHAPLAEQKTLLARELGWPGIAQDPPPPYVPQDLHRQGLTCVACHVRGHRRFGPPPRAGSPSADTPGLPHDGYSAQAAFTDSRFCKGCHQFPKDGPALNGKLLENTYAEWRASPYAAQGKSCQSCHMPQRRHQWRGIHDPEMVRQALTTTLEVMPADDGRLQVQAHLLNSGAGHYFPTYLVARVDVSLVLLDPQGQIQAQLAEAVISRDVDIWLTEERNDNRLPPGGVLLLEGLVDQPLGAGWQVELRVDVAPREHYERMFASVLQNQGADLAASTRRTLETALSEARASRFTALQVRREIPSTAIAN